MLELFRQAGVPRRELPAWETPGRASSQAPRIVSPKAAHHYTLPANDVSRRTIPLQAEAAAGVQQVYWFAGQEFSGSSPPSQPLLWTASPGTAQIRVIDDQGRHTSCDIRIDLVP